MYGTLHKLLLGICLCLLLAAIGRGWHYTRQYTGTDLESRIRGALLLQNGYNAYATVQDGQPALNGVSVPPVVLLMHYPLTKMSYGMARIVWWAVQYILLLLCIGYWWRQQPDTNRKLLVAVIAVVFFMCSPHWLLHVERGQVYILYACFFTGIHWLAGKSNTRSAIWLGILVAAAIWCRSIFIVCLLPLFLQKRKPFAIGVVIGLAVSVLVSIPFWSQWQDYITAINGYTGLNDAAVQWHTPLTAETQYSTGALPAMFKNDFLAGNIAYLNEYSRYWLQHNLPAVAYLLCYGLAVIAVSWWQRKQWQQFTHTQIFCIAFLLYISMEYCMAASRNPYNLIQWLPPVLVIAPGLPLRSRRMVLLLLGLALLSGFPIRFPLSFELGELLLFAVTARQVLLSKA